MEAEERSRLFSLSKHELIDIIEEEQEKNVLLQKRQEKILHQLDGAKAYILGLEARDKDRAQNKDDSNENNAEIISFRSKA